VGWLEDLGMVGSSGERDLGDIEWVPKTGYRRSYTNPQGERVTRALNAAEWSSIGQSPQSQETRLARDAAEANEARIRADADRKQGISDKRYEDSQNFLGQQLAAQLEESRGRNRLLSEQIAQQGTAASNAHELARLQYQQQGEQHNANVLLQTTALNNADRTANRKLDVEERLATQQQAENKSARKLQAIMGISQSLAQLRI
jgi:hypothetical protein